MVTLLGRVQSPTAELTAALSYLGPAFAPLKATLLSSQLSSYLPDLVTFLTHISRIVSFRRIEVVEA